MANNKTQPTAVSVKDFLAKVKNDRRREDAAIVVELMRSVSGEEPCMWGPSIIGFGLSHYKLASGKIGSTGKINFSPRSQALVFYLGSFADREKLLKKLGKHKTGAGGCLYINKLADIDMDILKTMIAAAYNKPASVEPPDQ